MAKLMSANCPNCESPVRSLWVLFGEHRQPQLTEIHTGTWICLERCEPCRALWCTSPYEPYAAFPYAAGWPFDENEWLRLHAQDDGQTLRGWHAYMVGQHFGELPADELEQVQRHRHRSMGHNPMDAPAVFHAAPLPGTSEIA